MASWHADFFVGEWRVSPKLTNISKGGQTVGVTHKSMAVLVCLADANGEVVSRNDIMDDVWPGMVVTDDVLTQSIVELRKAFDDDAKHPRVIETIQKVGFRLIARVAPASEVSGAASSTEVPRVARQYLIAALALLGVGIALWFLLDRQESARQPVILVEESPSIAVLPFVNMSDDPGNEYFSDGLSEEILNLLARIPGLKVIGRTSSFAFKGQNEDLRVIGQTLGVKTVLEGSVRKSGERVRITVQLVDVSDGMQIWSDSYDRTMTDIFAVQDDVAAAIIDALQIHVGAVPSRGRPTENTEAYALFLKARASFNAIDLRVAEEFLLQAIELDPKFAEAYELLAYTYWAQSGGIIEVAESEKLIGEAAAKALAIDPDLVVAQALLSAADANSYLSLGAIEALERAVREQPSNPGPLRALGWYLQTAGYPREALGIAERFVDLDPLSPTANWYLVDALNAVGRTSEAIAALELMLQLDHDFAKWLIGEVNLMYKQDDIAIAHFEAYLEQYGSPSNWVRELVTGARDPATGQAYLDRRLPQIVATMPEDAVYNWQSRLTKWYLYFGFLDRYFEIILDLDPTDSAWTYAGDLVIWGTTWRHLGFTAHPRYLEVADAFGHVELWERRGPPDFCEKVDGQWVCE